MTLGVLKYTFDSFQRFITWPSTPEFKISSVSPKNLVTYQHDRWLLVTNCSCDTVRCLTNVKNRLRQISVKSCAVIAYFNQSILSSSLQIRRTVTYSSQVQPMDYTCSCGISFILCCCLQQVVHQQCTSVRNFQITSYVRSLRSTACLPRSHFPDICFLHSPNFTAVFLIQTLLMQQIYNNWIR